jgi:hypothetical protein
MMADEAAEERESLLAIFGQDLVVAPCMLSVQVRLPPSFRVLCKEEVALANEIPRCPLEREGKTRSFLVESLPPILLRYECGPEYPAHAPPSFTITCPWLTLKQVGV